MSAQRKYDKAKIRDEVIRCGKDPTHFIKKYVKIKHPKKGLIKFDTWKYQEELIDAYRNNRFNVILKARQLGATEITASYCAWMLLFYKNKNILCVATKAETAKNIIRRVKTCIDNLPAWLKITKMTTDNKMSMEFDNGSVIKAIASSEDAGRSEAVSLLVVDEAAFIKNLDSIWTGLLPTVTAGGQVIMISTPNGVGNVFHTTFIEAKSKKNKFNPIELQWWLHPEHINDLEDDVERPGFKTSSWFREETKNMPDRVRAQEHELDFLSSGDTFITISGIKYIESTLMEPIRMCHDDMNLWVWNDPGPKKTYFVSVDVSRGDGTDFSTFHVFDTYDFVQVAEYKGKIPVDKFAHLICDTGKEYNNAVVIVENNSYGWSVLEHMKLWEDSDTGIKGYTNVYCSTKGKTETGECVSFAFDIPDWLTAGIAASSKMRPVVLNKLEETIRNRLITFRSRRFYQELGTFIWIDGKPQASSGNNDDLIMAGSYGAYIRETVLAPGFNSGEMTRQLVSSMKIGKVSNTDIRGASKNPALVPRQTLGSFYTPRDTYQMRVGRMIINMKDLLK